MTSRYALAAVIILLVVAALVFSASRPTALPQAYRNSTYKFSLILPADYKVTEVPSANPPAVNAPVDIIEFGNTLGNVQLTIAPAADKGSTLTKESILHDYPSMADETTEPVTVAPGVTGFAVPASLDHLGQMSELWFEHGGYLYQFSAFDAGQDQLAQMARTISLF